MKKMFLRNRFNIYQKMIIKLTCVIILLSNIAFGDQSDKKNQDKVMGFSVYGQRAQDEFIPSGWTKKNENLNTVPNWIDEKDKERGYLLFKTNYLDLIYPETLPNRDDVADFFEIFITPGEYEPITFCLRSLEDLKECKVNISDLISKDGIHTISKDNFDIRITRYFPVITSEKKYRASPLILEKKDSINLNKGSTQQWWITAYAPTGATAGDYFGKIILQCKEKPSKELILKMKVLPFKLKEPERAYGIYYHLDSRWKGFYPFNVNKHFLDIKEHGLNSLALYFIPYFVRNNGDIDISFEKPGQYCSLSMDEALQTYVNVGLNRPIIFMGLDLIVRNRIKADLGYEVFSKDFNEAFVNIVEAVEKEQKTMNWPEFIFSPSDEPALRQEKMEICKYYLRLLKETLPSSKTYMTLIGSKHGIDDGKIFDPWLDIRCYALVNKKIIEDTIRSGDELWVYNGGSFGKNPAQDRFFYGFYAERISAKGVMQWAYQWPATPEASPYTEMQSGRQGQYYTYPSINGPLPTIGWEGLREGIDDAKYIYTLRCLIDEARRSSDAVLAKKALEAEETIGNILNNLTLDFYSKNRLDNSVYDEWRWKIACKILELQELSTKVKE